MDDAFLRHGGPQAARVLDSRIAVDRAGCSVEDDVPSATEADSVDESGEIAVSGRERWRRLSCLWLYPQRASYRECSETNFL